MKSLASIVIPIKGRNWTFYLLTDRAFDKLHNLNEEQNAAMTVPTSYSVHFAKNHWDLVSILHELGHVYYTMAEVNSSNLTPEQVEETMCSIIGANYQEIGLVAHRVAECFFNYNK